MLELITGIVTLANTVMSFIQNEELLKYVREMKDLEQQLIDERAKGYDSDDAKIEDIYAQFHVVHNAFQNQLAVLKPTSAATSTTASGK